LELFCNQRGMIDRDLTFKSRLTKMDGTPLNLPEDLHGKVVFIQFWSVDHPPQTLFDEPRQNQFVAYTGLASIPSRNVVIVGVNLDTDRTKVEKFLKKSRYNDWIHTFSGLGWNDPVLRQRDIINLPHTLVLDRSGKLISTWISGFIGNVDKAVAQPPPPAPTPEP